MGWVQVIFILLRAAARSLSSGQSRPHEVAGPNPSGLKRPREGADLDGVVDGDIFTQDAVLAGTVKGVVRADSRLEVQSTCRVEGEIIASRMQLDEGAMLNGTVQMGTGSDLPPLLAKTPDTEEPGS